VRTGRVSVGWKKKLLELQGFYSSKKKAIEARLREFEDLYRTGSEVDIFAELAFCILTPQSKARSCWCAVEDICTDGLLLKGSSRRLSRKLRKIRFKNKKARYLVEARRTFTLKGRISIRPRLEGFKDPFEAREWLVKNVKGLGYKEASHFLRNIGMGRALAILDRHILRNLVNLAVIRELPTTLTRKRYLDIEGKMRDFSKRIEIPMAHLDLLLWCKETGEIFK
jgi:N-glycosylase/DNA lyase